MEEGLEKEQGYQILMETIEKLCELSGVARGYGLLALEEAAYDLEEFHNGEYLKSLIMLIVDGIDPDLVETISTTRYFASGVEGIDALQYILLQQGCLSIQAGENPRMIENKLLAFVPQELEKRYRKKQEQEPEVPKKKEEYDLARLEAYYTGDIAAVPGEECYYQMKVTDYAICSLDDRAIQRVLREVENGDLALAMKGLSGECRRRIFTNLSERLALMIAEDMDFMGPVRIKDVAKACEKIFGILIKLIRYGEIVCFDEQALCLCHDLFEATEDSKTQSKIIETENELLKIMREYSSKSNRRIGNE